MFTKEKDQIKNEKTNMARILTYIAKENDTGLMARDVIRREFRLVAHDVAKAKFRTKDGITVNGTAVMINYRLKAGDVLKVKLEDEISTTTVPTEGPLDIVYEDEDVLVLNKPAGLVVHPSHGHYADSLANYVAWHYQKTGQVHEIRTIGRLDKDTSGLIFYGKSRTACAHLVEQAEKGERTKTYLALAEGQFSDNGLQFADDTTGGKSIFDMRSLKGTIDAPITRDYIDKVRRAVRKDGDRAVTHYRVLHQYDGYALLSVRIETGRTHQIRVHMSYIGHPLLGDPLYGKGSVPGMNRAALHAYKVAFLQPFEGSRIELTAPIPEDFRKFLEF